MKRIAYEILDYIKIILIALIITNVITVFIFSLSQVQQSSMEKTLISNDQLIVEKISYGFSNPKQGDIIVFIDEKVVDTSVMAKFERLYEDMGGKMKGEEAHQRLVKRVIGVPGDEIDIKDGYVYVNGELLEEEYVNTKTAKKNLTYPLVVPEGAYYVLGDNRAVSLDSRDFNCIEREQIEGKVVFRIFPISKFGIVN